MAKIISLLHLKRWDNLFKRTECILSKRLRQTLYGDKLYKIAGILKSKSPDDIYKGFVSHWKTPENLILDSNELGTILDDFNIKASIPNYKERMMFFNLVTYLPDDILTKVDRASMAVSLEVRVPILDHRVVEFSKRLLLSFKIKNCKSKCILSQVLYKYIPKELIERHKMGFDILLIIGKEVLCMTG